MDNKKFEQLIDLIINENEEQARALFHDIVVEKSREIYESMMDMDEGLGGQVGGLLDEIEVEESGMMEADDEFDDETELGVGDDGAGAPDGLDVDDESVDDMGDMDDADMDDMDADAEEGEEDLEDRVVDLEEKLDQLMAEFEEIMNGEEDEEDGEEEFDAGEEDEESGEEEEEEGEEEEEAGQEEEDEAMMESKEAKQVAVPAVHNAPTKSASPALKAPAFKHGKAAPVNFTKGDGGGSHGNVSVGASPVKNPANKAGQKSVDLSPAPAAKKAAAAGNSRSPVAESKTAKRK